MKDTGGSAFPTYESNREGHIYCTGSGADLRDYLAAKAMPMIAAEIYSWQIEVADKDIPKITAEMSYKFADAMLEARKA